MEKLIVRFTPTLVSTLEVFLVAFLFILASRYWVVSEHVVYIAIFCATALLALTRRDQWNFTLRGLLPLMIFGGFAGWLVLSSLWSPSFHLSLGRAGAVALVAALAVCLGMALTPATVAKGLAVGVVFLVAHASLSRGFGVTGFLALGQEPGLFTNISSMTYLLGAGIVAVLLAVRSLRTFALASIPLALLFWITGMGIPVLTMFFATAGAIVIGLMVLHTRFSSESRQRVLRVVYPFTVIIGAVLLWFLREPILRPLGEDPNLSGRTIIWDWYFEAFLWEPIIGVGWGNTYNWPLTEGDIYPTGGYFIAHNGFLDIGLVMGGVGVVLIVATLSALFVRGAALATNKAYSISYLLVPALVSYITLNDIMATSLPRYIGVFLVGILVGLVTREPEVQATTTMRENKLTDLFAEENSVRTPARA